MSSSIVSSPAAGAVPRKSGLSPAQQRLVELMQSLNFGRVENLYVRAGQPVFDPAPRAIRTLKLSGGGSNGPRAESVRSDFHVKQRVMELFDQMHHLGDGVFARIEIAAGLPLLAEVQEPVPS